ncbi:MAG: hypothetical protein N3F03_06075 [Ignavibacteria bacterium]|nr:hypothetical protein [Ignavibacteria bacterium]
MSNSISSIQLKIFPDDSKLAPIIKSNLLSKINVDASSKNKLEVIIKDFNLEYPEIVSFPIFSEEKLKRKISVNLTYIVYTNGEIIFNNNFQEVYSDTIPISTINFEAQSTEKLPSISFWRKLVEPAIVTSVTGLIIYLFFTVRSK